MKDIALQNFSNLLYTFTFFRERICAARMLRVVYVVARLLQKQNIPPQVSLIFWSLGLTLVVSMGLWDCLPGKMHLCISQRLLSKANYIAFNVCIVLFHAFPGNLNYDLDLLLSYALLFELQLYSKTCTFDNLEK